ncbi:hypothetical protein GEMRC1_007715 [Eukaryota sp. GEM-RC1]
MKSLLSRDFTPSNSVITHLDVLSFVPIGFNGIKGTVLSQEELIVSVIDPIVTFALNNKQNPKYLNYLTFVQSVLIELIRSLKAFKIKPVSSVFEFLLEIIVARRDFDLLYYLAIHNIIVFDFSLAEYLLQLTIQAKLTDPSLPISQFVIRLFN